MNSVIGDNGWTDNQLKALFAGKGK
jgi:hypothetical protein